MIHPRALRRVISWILGRTLTIYPINKVCYMGPNGSHPHKYLLYDNTVAEFTYNTTPRSGNPIPQPYRSAVPLYIFTSFESTNKQGAVSQIIPPEEVYGEMVFVTSWWWSFNWIPHGFIRISPYPFPFNEILSDLTGPYVRIILHSVCTLTSHKCIVGIGRVSPQQWKPRHRLLCSTSTKYSDNSACRG